MSTEREPSGGLAVAPELAQPGHEAGAPTPGEQPAPATSRVSLPNADHPSMPPSYAPPGYGVARYPGGHPSYPPQWQSQRQTQTQHTNWVPWVIGGVVGTLILAAILVVALAALVAGLATGTLGGVTEIQPMTRQFTVAGVPSLVVHDSAGTVTIQQGAVGTVLVDATAVVRTANSSAAHNALRNTNISMSQAGDAVTVNAQFTTSWFDGIPSQRRVDLVITVPAGSSVEIHVAAGNITLTNTTATAVLDLSAGNLTLTGATLTGASRLTVNAGKATVDTALSPGASLDVNVSAGNAWLTVPADTPAHLSARTNVGTITIAGWPIAPMRTSAVSQRADGDLSANVRGNVTVTVATGNINVTAR